MIFGFDLAYGTGELYNPHKLRAIGRQYGSWQDVALKFRFAGDTPAGQILAEHANLRTHNQSMPSFNGRGILFVVSAPSGTGKSVITKRLLAADHELFLSISATTRMPRPYEINTSDYQFVSEVEFEEMIVNGGFLEWAKPLRGSARYGTPKHEVDRKLNAGCDVLLEIDWQGLRQVVEAMGEDVVSVYVLPPSLEEVERRLRERGQDDSHEILRRLDQTVEEARHWVEYEYVVINDNLNSTVERIQAIVTAERLRKRHQPRLADFVDDLARGRIL